MQEKPKLIKIDLVTPLGVPVPEPQLIQIRPPYEWELGTVGQEEAVRVRAEREQEKAKKNKLKRNWKYL